MESPKLELSIAYKYHLFVYSIQPLSRMEVSRNGVIFAFVHYIIIIRQNLRIVNLIAQ